MPIGLSGMDYGTTVAMHQSGMAEHQLKLHLKLRSFIYLTVLLFI